jgi:hypothetical protein
MGFVWYFHVLACSYHPVRRLRDYASSFFPHIYASSCLPVLRIHNYASDASDPSSRTS